MNTWCNSQTLILANFEPLFFNMLLNNIVFLKNVNWYFWQIQQDHVIMNVLFVLLWRFLIVCKTSYLNMGKKNLYDDLKKNQIYNKLLEKHP
jgi:hypothetical protein